MFCILGYSTCNNDIENVAGVNDSSNTVWTELLTCLKENYLGFHRGYVELRNIRISKKTSRVKKNSETNDYIGISEIIFPVCVNFKKKNCTSE